MIDTDKYEGHTKGAEKDGGIAWRIVGGGFVMNDEIPQPDDRFIAYVQPQNNGIFKVIGFSDADAQLITDAPLILQALKDEREEVKRLREAIEYAIVHAENHDVIRVLDEVMKND